MESLEVLYAASRYSPLNLNEGSGTDYQLYHALLNQGARVDIVGPFSDTPSIPERFYRKLHCLITDKRYAKYSLAFLRTCAAEVTHAIQLLTPDIVITKNVAPLLYAKPRRPFVYLCDTTLKGSQEQWPLFSSFEYLRMLNWEKRVIRNCSRVITRSEWSADILARDYGFPREHILVLPNAASLPKESVPAQLDLQARGMLPLNLLVVGREFRRKGVDIAIETVEKLNQQGISAQLRIVGLKGQESRYVQFMGVYNKSKPAELQRYISHYRWAHFLLHPARFEAAGIVPGEAAAFGVPTITDAAGGLATTVKDRVSGIVLPKDSPADMYVRAIQYFLTHPAEYQALRESSRVRFEQELNWDVAGIRIMSLLREAVREWQAMNAAG